MHTATCLIIDDEPLARAVLSAIITENCPEIKIIGTADDVLSGLKLIQQHAPDVVFLDVEMPGYSGFQLLEFFENIDFQVVFTTAHADFALRAFQVSAADYVLKPIQVDHIVRAVKKALILRGDKKTANDSLSALKENLREGRVSKIALPVSGGLMFVSPDDILMLAAEGSYTNIWLADGGKMLISKKLKEFEDLLEGHPSFYRTHRSYMINLKFVKQFNSRDGGVIVMSNNQEVDLAKDRRDDFFKHFDALSPRKEIKN
jgi:two-component system LytT family response regulator